MHRTLRRTFAVGALTLAASAASADPLSLDPSRPSRPAAMTVAADEEPPVPPAPIRLAQAGRNKLGGGFIEFIFSGGDPSPPPYSRQPEPVAYGRHADPNEEPAQREIDPQFLLQTVAYEGGEPAGTIIIDTPRRFLFLVQGNGTALRYGIGVGRPGFTWAGVKQVSMKREWPDWRPPPEMLKRRPDLPSFMAGGPENPLGARALYLGSSLYRIHGSNEPWTIGTQVSSGCIRMRNEDVMDLYDRVRVGAKVVVM
jgi:lipoprotein-anchoring transpeptidase ErfK/SrfK